MLNDVVRQVVSMTGATGSAVPNMSVITQKAEKINYISFANMNSNIVEIYPRFTDPANTAAVAPILTIGVYGAVTWPFTDEFKNGYLVAWTNAESGTDAQVKTLSIFFSETNIQMNTSQAPGFNSTLPSANVDIVGNTIGLAKSVQLPVALTAAGNLKISLAEQTVFNDVATKSQYGESGANAAVVVTLAAAAAGVRHYCSGFSVSSVGADLGAAVQVQILDGVTILHESFLEAGRKSGQTLTVNFSYPLQGTANTAMTLTVAAAGGANVTHNTVSGFSR